MSLSFIESIGKDANIEGNRGQNEMSNYRLGDINAKFKDSYRNSYISSNRFVFTCFWFL